MGGKVRYLPCEGWVLIDKIGNNYSVAINLISKKVHFNQEARGIIHKIRTLTSYHPRKDYEKVSINKDYTFFGYLLKSYGLIEYNLMGNQRCYLIEKSVKRSKITIDFDYVKSVLDDYMRDLQIG